MNQRDFPDSFAMIKNDDCHHFQADQLGWSQKYPAQSIEVTSRAWRQKSASIAQWLRTHWKWDINIPLSHELRSKLASEKTSERSGVREQREQVISASKPVSGWAIGLSGPLLTSRFQEFLNHCAMNVASPFFLRCSSTRSSRWSDQFYSYFTRYWGSCNWFYKTLCFVFGSILDSAKLTTMRDNHVHKWERDSKFEPFASI